jgi:hypothetical protein
VDRDGPMLEMQHYDRMMLRDGQRGRVASLVHYLKHYSTWVVFCDIVRSMDPDVHRYKRTL